MGLGRPSGRGCLARNGLRIGLDTAQQNLTEPDFLFGVQNFGRGSTFVATRRPHVGIPKNGPLGFIFDFIFGGSDLFGTFIL